MSSRGFTDFRRLGAGCAILATTLAAAPPAPYPRRTLILMVASWCAPCRGELARLDAIAAAAAPREVRVLPTDASRATGAMLRNVAPERVLRSAGVLAALSRETGGLPYSVMTDGAGRACAAHARPLDVPAVRAMRLRCDGAA